jgi:hypothetical protein
MEKIYIVFECEDYHAASCLGVFSTLCKAINYIESIRVVTEVYRVVEVEKDNPKNSKIAWESSKEDQLWKP